jgi:hypothetical protein
MQFAVKQLSANKLVLTGSDGGNTLEAPGPHRAGDAELRDGIPITVDVASIAGERHPVIRVLV